MCIQNLQLCHDYLQNRVSKQNNANPHIVKAIKDFGNMINNPQADAPKAHIFLDKHIKGPLLQELINNKKLNFITGDITEQHTDAIVNAANSELKVLNMKGVAGAMGNKGGQQLENECQKISQGQQLEKGKVYTTNSWKAGQKILHGITMDLGGKVDSNTVRKVTRNIIDEAKKQGCKSITLPLFGSGVGGLTSEQSKIAIQKGLYDKIGDLDYFNTINIIDYKPHTVAFNTQESTIAMAA